MPADPTLTQHDRLDMGWWVISGEALMGILRRVAQGEQPDLVYTEEYANSSHERPEDR